MSQSLILMTLSFQIKNEILFDLKFHDSLKSEHSYEVSQQKTCVAYAVYYNVDSKPASFTPTERNIPFFVESFSVIAILALWQES